MPLYIRLYFLKEILAYFPNPLTMLLSTAIKPMLYFSPHFECVTELPCEMKKKQK